MKRIVVVIFTVLMVPFLLLRSSLMANESNYLPIHSVSDDGSFSISYKTPLKPNDTLILALPGGPGISSEYMHEFIQKLGDSLGVNSAVVDLPNHDDSKLDESLRNNITYPEIKRSLLIGIKKIIESKVKLILLGHSLGAYIALDLSTEVDLIVSNVILLNMPTRFDQESQQFKDRVKQLGLENVTSWPTEKDFKDWWIKILPLYFYNKVSPNDEKVLSDKTFWIGNERFQENIPQFKEITSNLLKVSSHSKQRNFFFVEGDTDIIMPSQNKETIIKFFPNSKIETVKNSGHFPMLENCSALLVKITDFINQNNKE